MAVVLNSKVPDLLCFSHRRWSEGAHRTQHLMSRWARERRVFFIEDPLPDVGLPRLELRVEACGVRVITPRLPGGPGPMSGLLDELLQEQGVEEFISWYSNPLAIAFSRHLEPRAIVYDCLDELWPAHDTVAERELLGRADVVFTSGARLALAKHAQHRNVHAFPCGVDLEHFAAARTGRAEPEEQASIPHPRLGLYGVDDRFDLELVGALAELRPDWHFVLMGPGLGRASPRRPNLHYLDSPSYAQLPQAVAGWDVALLPFVISEATRAINPPQMLECLAAGLPVICTPLHDVVHDAGELGLVHIARGPAQFLAAIDASLREDRAERHERADAFLAGHSWDRTWSQMKKEVDRVELARAPVRLRKPRFDYLVVGAGFSGAVTAERLAEHGKRVLLVDKRPHLAGNAFDRHDAAGVLVHQYGPHIFHTNSEVVFDYLSRFTQWRPYEHRVLAQVDGKLLPMPINLDTVNGLYGWNLDSEQLAAWFASVAVPLEQIRSSEDVIVSKVGRELYEKFFRNYTFKQWGLYPSQLDPTVIARIPVRTNRDDRYFTDTFQAMPARGYTALFERMLDHPRIALELDADYRDVARRVSADQVVYSGPIDEYFEYCHGHLPYRSIDFRFETLNERQHQPVAVVNYPNEHAWTRVTEFKHLTGQQAEKTTLVYEYPKNGGDPYYPVPRPENAELYRKYQALAARTPGVHFVGRLGTYKYFNMDQCVAQALTLATKLLGARRVEPLGRVQGQV